MKRYYSGKELCEMFGISLNTVRKYYKDAVVRIGRCVRYDLEIIERRNNDSN